MAGQRGRCGVWHPPEGLPEGFDRVAGPETGRGSIARFDELGMRPLIGPELEFYVFEPSETSANGWRRYGEAPGNVYATGLRGDPDNLLLRLLRNLSAYEVDVFAANHEYSSGQFEINLWHSEALDAADRSATSSPRRGGTARTTPAWTAARRLNSSGLCTPPPASACGARHSPGSGARSPCSAVQR